MAWRAMCLLSPILLAFLAPGSCAQDTELLQTVEGETVSVKCQYDPSQRFKEKIWCRKTSEGTCKILWSSVSTGAARRLYTIQDNPASHFFTVNMTALKMRDSGTYYCAVTENHTRSTILRVILLLVLKDSLSIPASGTILTWTVTEVPTFNTTKPLSTMAARVSVSSVIIPVACGLFSKTLVFTVLLAVTRRSIG